MDRGADPGRRADRVRQSHGRRRPSDVGRRLDAPIFRKAREAITVGVEWPQLRARRLVPPRFPPGKPAGAENDRKRAPDVAYVCADGALISGKSYVFEPLESQLASVASG